MRLLKRASASIINDLRQNEYNIVQLNDVRLYDKYTFNHSVNVSILATMVGIDLGYNEQQLDDLSIGALMHDVGKMKVSRNILNKPSHLDPGEMAEMSKHPTYGLELLDTSPVTMSETARQIVVQHHERFDGTGYPKKLCGKEISEMARIVSIADVYDALTSDRPYKCAYMPSVAYKMMNGVLARGFDPDLLKIFLRHIAFYPQGSVVRMKNGDYAIVRALNGDDLSKPQVEIIADSSYKLYEPHKFMDLREYEDGKIDSVLNEMESMRIYLLLNRKR
jgi:putative nucleotidyltransferase with HDIG domain